MIRTYSVVSRLGVPPSQCRVRAVRVRVRAVVAMMHFLCPHYDGSGVFVSFVGGW